MTAEPASYDLFRSAERSAVHLEMRDAYTPDDPVFVAWQAGQRIEPAEVWRDWFDLIVDTVARGVTVRRARIVSEPVTEYIKFEYDVTEGLNITAGEQVRWLPRRHASDIAVPCSDFWLFDDRFVIWNHFAGDGSWVAEEKSDDPAVARLCTASFEAVWERATPHQGYLPT